MQKKMFDCIIARMGKLKENLENKMKEKGFNMSSLSKAAGLEVTAIKHIIYEQTVSPKIVTVAKLADALECTIDELYGRKVKINNAAINDKEIWKKCIRTVDTLISESKKNIDSETKADLYLACYEFQLEGTETDISDKIGAILKFIQK